MNENASVAAQRPKSAVSHGVGVSGLIGLVIWIAIARHYGMDGPYSAMTSVAVTGLPMVLWSVFVDKVHLRPSTGLDWSSKRPVRDIIDISITKLAGYWATWGIIAVVYCIARFYWQGQYQFSMSVLGAAAPFLIALSIPYVIWIDRHLVNLHDGAWHFGAFLAGRHDYEKDQIFHHLRAWAVKGFFLAFMISIVPGGFAEIIHADIAEIITNPVWIAHWLIVAMFVVDVQLATVGYMLTFKPLDSHIRTANPYLAGWVAALMCYPPFVLMNPGMPLDYGVNTADWAYWMEGHTVLLSIWGGILVFLTAAYAWATMAFGLRFSNLTHRGILTHGPYAWTRHPAYVAKNIYWWLSTMPFLVTSHSMTDAIRNTSLIALTSAVYFWRAKTEEKHLRADPDYEAYWQWANEHAPITRSLRRLTSLRPRRHPDHGLHPAE